MRLWNVITHQAVGPPLPSHKGTVIDVDFSHDGRRIGSMSYLIGSDPSGSGTSADGARLTGGLQLRITDASSGRPIVDGLTELSYRGNDLAFSPDGRRVAIGSSDGKIRVLDADTGAAVGPPLSGHTGAIKIVVYSGDGTRIISSGDNTIHVWAAEPDQSIGNRLPGLAFDGSLPAAVSPDARVVATRDVNNESDIALWRIDIGELVRTISTGYLDGNHIVSRGADDGWMLWPGPNSWRDELCDKLTANMTRTEWDEWVSPTIDYRAPCPSLDMPE
jgi:WD40 repeat protein